MEVSSPKPFEVWGGMWQLNLGVIAGSGQRITGARYGDLFYL